MLHTFLDTPIGPLLLAGDGHSLSFLGFPGGSRAMEPKPQWQRDDAAFALARAELAGYFEGTSTLFTVPLSPVGTLFQKEVWAALCDIPHGETISYGELARRIGRPSASRAVGAANGANPLPVIVPCHRVIGTSGALTGFGGGIETKKWLLDFERGHAATRPQQAEFAFG